jgi:hypothetical protein
MRQIAWYLGPVLLVNLPSDFHLVRTSYIHYGLHVEVPPLAVLAF